MDNKHLTDVINYLVLQGVIKNAASFAARIGISPSRLTDTQKNRRPMTPAFIQRVCVEFPQINPEYLTDENSVNMVIPDGENKFPPQCNVAGNVNFQSPSATINAPDPELIKSLRAEIVRLNDQIVWMRNLIDKLTVK